MRTAMVERSPLDDPRNAAHAWRRFRWLMKVMSGVALLAVVLAMLAIYFANGFQSWNLYIATAIGVGLTMLLTGALMGLVFLSSGTGHDDSVKDASAREWLEGDDSDQGSGESR